jgi:hypothetical protein
VIAASLIRAVAGKLILTLWPAKDGVVRCVVYHWCCLPLLVAGSWAEFTAASGPCSTAGEREPRATEDVFAAGIVEVGSGFSHTSQLATSARSHDTWAGVITSACCTNSL